MIHTAQALVDEVIEVPSLPDRGQNVMATRHQRYAGGAVTILLAAVRQGADCVHAGAHGTGPNGDLVREVLGREGVTLSAARVPDRDTGVCVVLLEPSAERTFVTTMEAERLITVDTLASSDPQPGDLVCVSGYSLFEPTRDPLLAWLAALPHGVEVVLDSGAAFASMPSATRDATLAATTVWTSNADEARALTGLDDLDDATHAVAALLPAGAVVIVRDGPQGCRVLIDQTLTHLPGHPQTPVDTNGAGDVHTGVLVACRALGRDWLDAAARGNAAGAIKVTRRGPDTAPKAAEIDAFLAV